MKTSRLLVIAVGLLALGSVAWALLLWSTF